jgi:uncharacterized protein YuzE
MTDNRIELDDEENDVVYVVLPKHTGETGVVCSSLRLRELFLELGRADLLKILGDTDIVLDCNLNGDLIGIEILI